MAHGINIREEALGAAPVEPLDFSCIGLVGTAPDAKVDGLFGNAAQNGIEYNQPFLLTRRGDAPSLELGERGSLPLALDTIYAQGSATVAMSIVQYTENVPDDANTALAVVAYVTSLTTGTTPEWTYDTTGATNYLRFRNLAATDITRLQASAVGRTFSIASPSVVFTSTGKLEKVSDTEYRLPVTSAPASPTITAGNITITPATQAAVDGDAANRTAATGNEANLTGVYSLLAAENLIGRRPRILTCAGIDTGTQLSGAKNPLGGAMEEVAGKLRAIALIDGPNTTHADAVAFAGDYNSMRTLLLDPGCMVFDASGQLTDAALSGFVAGLIAKNDQTRGWWTSPSNQPLLGVRKLKRPIDYNPGDANSRAQLLNDLPISTVIRYGGGFTFWGNRLPATANPAFKFMSVRRIADQLEDSIQESFFWAVDKNITKNFLSSVADRVNGFIRTQVAQGALIGGLCYPDGELNNPDEISQGHVYFNVKFTPPYPAEEVFFNFQLTNEYLTTLAA